MNLMQNKIQEHKQKILSHLNKLEGKKLLVVGDIGLDEYVIGQVKRISPEAPVPVLEVKQEEYRLGLATNVAQNISALGGIPLLVSVVGNDPAAESLKKLLRDNRVSTEHLVVDPSRPTTRKLRAMAGQHHIVRVDFEQKKFLSQEVQTQLIAKVTELMPQCDGVILQDYAKGVLSEDVAQKVIALAKKHNKRVMVDPNVNTPIKYYKGADVMTPNYNEAITLSGLPFDDLRAVSEEMLEVGESLMKQIGSSQMVITRSQDGMSLFENGKSIRVPTFARQVFDVTGAGDTVIAAFSLAWVSGFSLEESCVLANYAAGVVVGKIGCVPCYTRELEAYMKSH